MSDLSERPFGQPAGGASHPSQQAVSVLPDAHRAQGWQPISTAPRVEGDTVILWNGVVVVAGSAWESGWVDAWLDWVMPQPTHWRELPEPPEAA